MQYAWDLPALANKQLKITVNGVERIVNVLEIGSQIPFRFPVSRDRSLPFETITDDHNLR